MSRKRSKYRPRVVIYNTMEFVRFSVARAGSIVSSATHLKLELHEALAAMYRGEHTRDDLGLVLGSFHVGEVLCRKGISAKHWPVFDEAITAMTQYTGSPEQLSVIARAVAAHDAQIDVATVGEIDAAVLEVERKESAR